MDKRCALPKEYELRVRNHHNGELIYKIKSEIARGGSCIVYDATYLNNSGVEKLVRVKECYPFRLNIYRDDDSNLYVPDTERVQFDEYKKRLSNAFNVMNDLFMDEELTNTTSNSFDIYTENNTLYVVSVYVQGNTLSKCKDLSFREVISVVKAVAKAIKEIHRNGYLYLDIKPDNVWVLKGTTELIQLFDFDSIFPVHNQAADISDYRISYTKGFAAYELQMGEIANLGIHTDVYGIGALLFACIFGRVPSVLDRDIYAKFDYTKTVFNDKRYRDKLFVGLTDFFHNTLSDYYVDRYEDMNIVISKLENLERLADEERPYICSSDIICEKKLIGRQKELQDLSDWCRSSKKILYVTGFRGIGRSSLVRTFLCDNKEVVGTFAYLEYKGDIVRTIIDDGQFPINTVERNPGEDDRDYFIRKIGVIRSIVHEEDFLLVINNYFGEECEELRILLNIDCRFIFITHRTEIYGENELNIRAITNRNDVHAIFECYINSSLTTLEAQKVDSIFESIAGNTLVLELIAKQILSSRSNIESVENLVLEQGFSQIGLEKIRYSKDDTEYYATIANIINAIFDASNMNVFSCGVLKAIALFGSTGVSIDSFVNMINLYNLDVINELKYDSWIEINGDKLTVHPIISEVIHTWDQKQTVDELAIKIMNHVFKVIRLENHREDYSKRLLNLHQVMLETYTKNKWLKKRYDKDIAKQGVIGEIVSERMKRGGDCIISNHDLLKLFLVYAENIITFSQRDRGLHATSIFKDLLYETIIAMPHDREDYIMSQSKELVNDETISNSITMMRLFDRRVSVCCERKDFDAALTEIEKAKKFLKRYSCNFSVGQYYNIQAEYYDSLLDGAYEDVSKDEKEYLSALVKCINNAIKYTRRSRSKYRKELQLIECLLSKVNILIRSKLGSKKEINKILDEIQSLIRIHCQPNSTYVKDFYMTCAWYATRIEGSYKVTGKCAMEAAEISLKTATSELQFLDEIVIPYANMLLELERYDSAIHWLNVGVKLCEEYPQIVPYIRKKIQLYCYMMDVYDILKDYDKCVELIHMIDILREEHLSIDIGINVSDDIRERVMDFKMK